MTKRIRSIKTAMVPIGVGTEGENALALAHSIAEKVIVVGIVATDDDDDEHVGESMVNVRKLRKRLLSLGREVNTRFKASVIASSEPWRELKNIILDEEPDILITEWKD